MCDLFLKSVEGQIGRFGKPVQNRVKNGSQEKSPALIKAILECKGKMSVARCSGKYCVSEHYVYAHNGR